MTAPNRRWFRLPFFAASMSARKKADTTWCPTPPARSHVNIGLLAASVLGLRWSLRPSTTQAVG